MNTWLKWCEMIRLISIFYTNSLVLSSKKIVFLTELSNIPDSGLGYSIKSFLIPSVGINVEHDVVVLLWTGAIEYTPGDNLDISWRISILPSALYRIWAWFWFTNPSVLVGNHCLPSLESFWTNWYTINQDTILITPANKNNNGIISVFTSFVLIAIKQWLIVYISIMIVSINPKTSHKIPQPIFLNLSPCNKAEFEKHSITKYKICTRNPCMYEMFDKNMVPVPNKPAIRFSKTRFLIQTSSFIFHGLINLCKQSQNWNKNQYD